MESINLTVIQKLSGPKIFEKGQQLYNENKVNLLSMDQKKISNNEIELIVNFQVNGQYQDDFYKVNIIFSLIDNNTFLSRQNCTCVDYNFQHKICQHIIATLLFSFYESKENIFDWNKLSTATDKLLNLFKVQNKIINEPQEKNIECSCTLVIDSNFLLPPAIQIKLGLENEQFFDIKNIYNFLTFLAKHESDPDYLKGYEVSQKFIFYPTKMVFLPYSKKIITFLQRQFANIFSFLQTQKMDFYGVSITKSFGLSAYQVDSFLNNLVGEVINLQLDNEIYNNVKIVSTKYQSNIEIKLVNHQIKIINNDALPILLTNNQSSLYFNNHIYLLDETEQNTLGILLKTMQETKQNQIIFPASETNNVIREIISVLDYEVNNIKIDEKILTLVEKTPLIIESYLDFNGKNILLRPVFKYGNLTFNILNQTNNSEKIVLRNIQKEQHYLTFLKKIGFIQKGDQLVLSNLEYVIKLLKEHITQLEFLSTVFYTNSFKNVRLTNVKITNFMMNVNKNKDLLEFNFEVAGIDESEMTEMITAINLGEQFYQLESGKIVDLKEQTLQKFTNLLNQFSVEKHHLASGKLQVPKYYAMTIYNNLSAWSEFNFTFDDEFNKLINEIKKIENNEFSVPISLDNIMRQYQKKGYFWLKTLASLGFSGILADEMGLGKTLQTISFILKEYELNPKMTPILIVAPAALIYNWKNEITRFAPSLKTLVISGDRKVRTSLFKEINNVQVVITSYPLLRRDIEQYEFNHFKYCFIDEAQYIKNPQSINARVIKTLNASIRFALTGTPMENNLTELWSIFDFVLPGFLLHHYQFQKRYEIPIIREQNQIVKQELLQKIAPFILRRLKKDVIIELPDKIEDKVLIEMTDRQKKIYTAYVTAAKQEINKIIAGGSYQQNRMKIFATLTKLRQICCDPSIINEKYQNESGKLDAIRDIFLDLVDSGHKILVFSQFTTILKRIVPILNELNLSYLYLDGKTRSESRVMMTQKFNEDDSINVFLISLKAGGVGLNLTAADVVIHFDPWWNPSIENQATDRAHRIGQKKTVQVIKLITKGTIEEKIIEIQQEKQNIINTVLNSKNENELLTTLTETQLRKILEM